jgi:hypothetical protein
MLRGLVPADIPYFKQDAVAVMERQYPNEGAMAGDNLGPAIVAGNAEESLLIQLRRAGHPNSLAPSELEWIEQWINEGAPES